MHNPDFQDSYSNRTGTVWVAVCDCGWRSIAQDFLWQAARDHREHVAMAPAAAGHTCQGDDDRTPSQRYDTCPRCQHLVALVSNQVAGR